MKKIVLIIALLLCVTAVVGCVDNNNVNNKSEYDVLNELTKIDYSVIKLETTTTLDGESLKGEYVSTAINGGYRVDYKYEKINTFNESDGQIVVPEEYKSEFIGSATVRNGKVEETSGAESDLPIGELTAANFTFNEAYFSDITQREGNFFAKVKNVKGFLGQTVSSSNMTVTVNYSNTALNSLTIRYRTAKGAQVLIVYTFKISA